MGGRTSAAQIISSKQTSRTKPTSVGGSSTTSVQQASSSTTTPAGGIWAQRYRERIENGKEFLRKLLGFADEDDEGDVHQAWLEEVALEEVEEMKRRTNRTFIQVDADETPSSRTSVMWRRESAKRTMMMTTDFILNDFHTSLLTSPDSQHLTCTHSNSLCTLFELSLFTSTSPTSHHHLELISLHNSI